MISDGKVRDRARDEAIAEYFRSNPSYAAELLVEVRNSGDVGELTILLRQLNLAFNKGTNSVCKGWEPEVNPAE